jgi:hypothetical protein
MFLGRKQFVFYCLIFGVFIFLHNKKNKNDDAESLPEFKQPQNSIKFKRPSTPKSSIRFAGFDSSGEVQAVLKLKIGSGPNNLGVDTDNAVIGPGMIKKSESGFMVSDTFNNRILKLSKSGEQELEISFANSSLLQGFAENKRGDIWSVRREGSELYLDQFDFQGRKKNTAQIKTKVDEFKNYAGTFRTFFSNGDFYIANSQHVLRVNSSGESSEVPGIPMDTNKGIYISARQNAQKKFIVDLKSENNKIVKSFYAQGNYESLGNIFSDSKGQIHVEFEHTFESKSDETGETVVTQSSIVESYTDDGKFIKEEMIDKSSDAEIDQDLDIDTDGNLNHVTLRGSEFEIYERLI